jgi:hypothetical protein
MGTCSILAALDLHDGHVIAHVERRHRSIEFIALLKDLDTYYPPECNIRLILDKITTPRTLPRDSGLSGFPPEPVPPEHRNHLTDFAAVAAALAFSRPRWTHQGPTLAQRTLVLEWIPACWRFWAMRSTAVR